MSAADLVKRTNRLFSMPAIAIRIFDMVDDAHYSAQDIGKVISQDPALTARLLKIANSALFGYQSEIDTVTRAITVLGSRQIRDLVLATTVIKTFTGISDDLVTMEKFWYHSMACGLAARALSMKCFPERSEPMFIAGLLHDIGQLILYQQMPEQGAQILSLMRDGAPPEVAEQQVIGFNHADVGAELITSWQLPGSFRECIECHHDFDRAGECQIEVALIYIASALAVSDSYAVTSAQHAISVDQRAWDVLGLDDSVCPSTMDTVKKQIDEVYRLFTV